jgi:uncharacterized protein (TIGR03000 family)
MYKWWLSMLAGVLAIGAFAVTPNTALARGGRGGGGHAVGHAGGAHWGGGHAYYGGRGWGDRGWGWGGFGTGLGVGLALDRGWGWGGYGYGPGYYGYSSPYYYGDTYSYAPYYSGDTGTFYNTTPYYGGMNFDNGTPIYNDTGDSGYAYGSTVQDNGARIRVIVPQDAKVWFDNRMTQQTGTERNFQSPALTPGRDFSYDVKAQWKDQNGKEVTQTRHVDVRANSNVTVDFMHQNGNQ